MATCSARQYSDQMRCARCGLSWDAGDADRPMCLSRPAAALKTYLVSKKENDAKAQHVIEFNLFKARTERRKGSK